MLCFVVVMQSFIMNSHEVFIHIHQGCFAGTGAIVILPQCQWSKPDGYGKISQCITTTKHSKAKTVCIFLGIYCMCFGSSSHRAKSGLYFFIWLNNVSSNETRRCTVAFYWPWPCLDIYRTGYSIVEIKAYRLVGAKPVPKSLLT